MSGSKPRRSATTRATYYREGRRHVAQAMAKFPALECLAALQTLALERDVLSPATTRRYAQDLDLIIRVICRASHRDPVETERVAGGITATIRRRAGTPAEPPTATKKVVDMTMAEAETVFGQLKLSALRYARPLVAATALYCVVAPRIGCRPIELCGAWMDGSVLHLPTAKTRNGAPVWRHLDLAAHHPLVIEATRMLTALVPPPGDATRFSAWRNARAENLNRACEAVGNPRGSASIQRATSQSRPGSGPVTAPRRSRRWPDICASTPRGGITRAARAVGIWVKRWSSLRPRRPSQANRSPVQAKPKPTLRSRCRRRRG